MSGGSLDGAEAYRLSPQQRRLWGQREHGVGSMARATVSARGELDLDRLRRAAETVVARHEILRTLFIRQPGFRAPFQVIEPRGEVEWVVDDVGGGVDPESSGTWLRRAAPEGADPSRGPVLRVAVERVTAERHLLRLELPALCADRASLRQILAELAAAYAGGDLEADEPVQYADYAEWQQELLEEKGDPATLGAQRHWEGFALEDLRSLRLPFEYDGGSIGAAPGRGSLPVPLDPAEARELESAEALGVGADSFWLTCWSILLARRGDASVAPLVARLDGRLHDELAGSVGLFERWVPLRVPVEDLRFDEALTRWDASLTEAKELQDQFSWDLVCDGANRDAALDASGFESDELPTALRADGVEFALTGRHVELERLKLTLSRTAFEGGVELRLSWIEGRYRQEDVERLATELATLARSAASAPATPVEALPTLDEAERRRLVTELNATGEPSSADRPVHEWIVETAEGSPDAAAVICGEDRITYEELGQASAKLAHHLRSLGVGPDTLVALCFERSVEMIVGLLGVLRAGGAYVPLEPAQPKRRLAMMLEDAGWPIVLTQGALTHLIPPEVPRTLCLDTDWDEIDAADAEPPGFAVALDNLAYVIFTSGTTGRPKGVAVEHRQLASYVSGALEHLDLPAGGGYALVSTLGADLGNTSLFPALVTGGTLHVIQVETASDAGAFSDYMGRHTIDCLKIVPSHFRALEEAAEERQGILPRRRLVLGGEASDPAWAMDLSRDGCRIFNHYGPSETTVGVLTFPVEPDTVDPRCSSLPLGRPLPGVQVYVLDHVMEPVPGWMAGELYIGGRAPARGYFGRPAETAERFIPDPFGERPGGRLYRTGDLGRFLTDGTVEFLGRLDRQVKFHGFRVELAELRATLNEHPGIRDSVVQMTRDRNDRQTLVCYYVARKPLEVTELRDWLGQTILEETLPNVFVHLRRLPLTLNGKISYEALPSLEEVRERQEKRYVAPRTSSEAVVAKIWEEVLGVDRVGARDHFFELGGHSLLATRMVSRIAQRFGATIPLRTLFESPTVAGVAAAVDRVSGGEDDVGTDDLKPGASGDLERELERVEQLSDHEVEALLGGGPEELSG